MKEYIKNNWKFLIFVLISGLIGGYCTGLYIPEMYSQEMLQQLQGQGMTTERHFIWCYTWCDRFAYFKESRFMERIPI